MSGTNLQTRNTSIDLIKTVAIFGTILIHVTANGGFSGEIGSLYWTSSLFWGTLIRCAVPLFFMCSGALLLPPSKPLDTKTVWKKYILRIFIALAFWATAYALCNLMLLRLSTGVLTAADVKLAVRNLLLFEHERHFYYLHITLLVYAMLPVTRTFVANASPKTLNYALALWLVLSCLYPTLRGFFPDLNPYLIPAQYVLNISWGAIGLGVLGYVMSTRAQSHNPLCYAALFLVGLCITFGGTYLLSVRGGWFNQLLIQGNAVGVYMQAIGLFGLCTALMKNRTRAPALKTVSDASFCIYLVHLFFLGLLDVAGINVTNLNPLWSAPVMALAIFGASFLVWLILRRIPIVNRWLI